MDWSKLLLLAAIQLLMWCDSVHCESKGGGNYHFFARGGMMPDFQAQDIKVVFQGEPGAYSEKSLRELLGPRVTAIGMQSFEDAFRAVAAREADYALLPVENTLGGSIHANYDLQLKYQLHIVAEHEFRVEHSLLALPGTRLQDVRRVLSHPQALAQCDGYLRQLGVEKVPKYDTAGSAKMIKENNWADAAAIASDLAGETYGMEVLATNIEDDDCNYTRFLLLGREPVSAHLRPGQPAKTSLVFTLSNEPGALYKALACFSLRDIDFSKIESRPTSANLLQYLRFQQQHLARPPGGGGGAAAAGPAAGPAAAALAHAAQDASSEKAPPSRRFSYCFYLDLLASALDDRAQLALSHLREQAAFVRVLGTYPSGSQLVGPIAQQLEALARAEPPGGPDAPPVTLTARASEDQARRLRIGVVGFGKFGQFLARALARDHDVVAMDKDSKEAEARELGVPFYSMYEQMDFFAQKPDVIVVACSIISFENVLRSMPVDALRGKLVVDVLSVKQHAKEVMEELLPADCDLLATHPMFGPESAGPADEGGGWAGRTLVYDRLRVADARRCDAFLGIFEKARCRMVELPCAMHDAYAANAQFVTHLVGRALSTAGQPPLLQATPIDTQACSDLLRVVERTSADSFDLFYGLYAHNPQARETLLRLREAFAHVERQLAAKEAYLTAKAEMAHDERQKLIAEARGLIKAAMAAPSHSSEEVTLAASAAAGRSAAPAREPSRNVRSSAFSSQDEGGPPRRRPSPSSSSTSPTSANLMRGDSNSSVGNNRKKEEEEQEDQ